MYPGNEKAYAVYTYKKFKKLKSNVEELNLNLNQIVSWEYADSDDGSDDAFDVVVLLPRLAQVVVFRLLGVDDEDALKKWVDDYLRPRAKAYFDVPWEGYEG